jgi:hypothetical protein
VRLEDWWRGFHWLVRNVQPSFGNLLFMRFLSGLNLKRSIVAGLCCLGFSWLFVAAIPNLLLGYALGKESLVGDINDPISWTIPCCFRRCAVPSLEQASWPF